MRRWWVAAVGVAAALVLAACSNSNQPPPDPLQRHPGQVYLYGTDGNMSSGIGDLVTAEHPNALLGMKGTTALTPLTQNFKDRLAAIDPSLQDYTYSGEAYDAVVISSLAAEIAGSTKSADIAAQIDGVTNGGEVCDTPAQCMGLVKAGHDIRYRGISLGLGGFTDVGEPSAATYGILRFGTSNKIDASLTQFVPAGNPSAASQTAPPAGGAAGSSGGKLKIGALLPHTGDLAPLGPPIFAGGELAVKEINDAGGVLGQDVVWVDGDDGTNPAVAKATADRLINDEKVQVIIGAAASGVTAAVMPTVVGAGVVLFSPSATSASLTGADDHGLFFRTAPPDGLQAAALADIIARDGVRKLAIVYRNDSYGDGLSKTTRDDLVAIGLSASAITLIDYDPANEDAVDFDGIGKQVRDLDPDGVLLISFAETAKVVDGLIRNGVTGITN